MPSQQWGAKFWGGSGQVVVLNNSLLIHTSSFRGAQQQWGEGFRLERACKVRKKPWEKRIGLHVRREARCFMTFTFPNSVYRVLMYKCTSCSRITCVLPGIPAVT